MRLAQLLLLIAILSIDVEDCYSSNLAVEIPLVKSEVVTSFDTGPLQSSTGLLRRGDDPIGGGIRVLGTYYIQVIANGQPLRLLIDTGSSVTYLPDHSCHLYDQSTQAEPCHVFSEPLRMESTGAVVCGSKDCSGCQDGNCVVSTSYLDGSGVMAMARSVNITLGRFEAASAIVGLVFRSSRGFRYDASSKIDGLLGMGYSKKDGFPTVYDSWIQAEGTNDIFALQLGASGGALSIGGYNPSYFKGELNWTPLLGGSHYKIPNPSFVVEGDPTSVRLDSKVTTIVDSGTTHLLIPPGAFDHLSNAIILYLTKSLGKCPKNVCTDWEHSILNTAVCTPALDTKGWPSIGLTMQRKFPVDDDTKEYFTLTMRPNEYFVVGGYQGGAACYSFGLSKGPANQLILGDTFMTSYYSIFDRQNSRMGFAHSTKSSQVVPTDNPVTVDRQPDLSEGSVLLATFWMSTLVVVIAML